jgi:hypothetical protein
MKLIDERQDALEGKASGVRPAPPMDLLNCAAQHLRAVETYERLVTSNRAPDLDAEANSRQEVIHTLADLRRALQQNVEESSSTRPDLLLAVQHYATAEQQRSDAARAFTDSKLDLPALERAIEIYREAADQIRLAVLNSGTVL